MQQLPRRLYRTVLFLAFIFGITQSACTQTRLAVPSYQTPGTTVWNNWAASGPSAVGIMIVNPSNGDDQTFHASIATAVQKAKGKGIHVLGYTYTSYGTRDPKVVRQKIDALYQNYLVDGILFDEAPTDCSATNNYLPTSFLYYQQPPAVKSVKTRIS